MTLRILFLLPCLLVLCHPLADAKGVNVHMEAQGQEVVLPDRNIKYARENSLPVWKIEWDQAREFYRQGKTGQALVQYELLLQKKSTIDEARWEYATLLIQKERWQQAGKELDTLLAHEPENQKILFARAAVYLEEDLGGPAVELYRQLYTSNSTGDKALQALGGLIAGLEKQGKKEEELPLLEECLLLKPGDLGLIQQIAALALELGRAEKAVQVLKAPLATYPANVDILRLFARAQEAQYDRDQAAVFWQQLISLAPDDMQANAWLANYYQHKGNYEMALIHVERQLKLDPGSVALILVASRLHLQLNHLGQALNYQNFYLDLVPDDTRVMGERDHTRERLARDLLVLVEHRKVELLWQDLEQVTNDRAGVYWKMADLLRAQGKEKKLADVLLLIRQYYPDNQDMNRELVALLKSQGRLSEL